MKEKHESTVRDQLLTDHAYKITGFMALGELLVVLILPLFKHLNLSVSCLGVHLITLSDLFMTFFQRHRINAFISLLLGNLLSFVICIILFVYIIWASGNMVFTK